VLREIEVMVLAQTREVLDIEALDRGNRHTGDGMRELRVVCGSRRGCSFRHVTGRDLLLGELFPDARERLLIDAAHLVGQCDCNEISLSQRGIGSHLAAQGFSPQRHAIRFDPVRLSHHRRRRIACRRCRGRTGRALRCGGRRFRARLGCFGLRLRRGLDRLQLRRHLLHVADGVEALAAIDLADRIRQTAHRRAVVLARVTRLGLLFADAFGAIDCELHARVVVASTHDAHDRIFVAQASGRRFEHLFGLLVVAGAVRTVSRTDGFAEHLALGIARLQHAV